MDYRLSMEDLGIANDSTVLEAETPGELVEKVVEHLRAEHDIDMPDADAIMGGAGRATLAVGGAGLNPVTSASGTPSVAGVVVGGGLDDIDDAAVIIVSRLREILNLQHLEDNLDV